MTRVNPARIVEARLKANHSQESLARACGTSARNIFRWEHGKHAPRSEYVAAIAEATGQDMSFFFSPNGEDEDEEESEALATDLLNSLRKIVEAEAKRARKEERATA